METIIPKRRAGKRCPDCLQCQACSPGRCGLCRAGGNKHLQGELGPHFTHGWYLEWKKGNQAIDKIPAIDVSACTACESCIELCPSVFRKNDATGLMEVVDLPEYPEDLVHGAMACCPRDCIRWEDRR